MIDDRYKKNVYEAKESLKKHIHFFEQLLKYLNGTDESLRAKSIWTTYCLNQYVEFKLIDDVELAILKHCAVNDPK
mgnify:CR=1 FL=1